MPPIMSLIHPASRQPFLSTMNGGRMCFALPYHTPFAVRVSNLNSVSYGNRLALVMGVDGRNIIDNTPASKDGQAYLVRGDEHLCLGFRTSADNVREFVFLPNGAGTVAEHNGTADSHGLVSIVLYNEAAPLPVYPAHTMHTMRGGDAVMRGGGELTRSASGGAGAGRDVASHVSSATFIRQTIVHTSIIEYDTRESWAQRGVFFQRDTHDAWPGDAPKFSQNLDSPPIR